MIKISIIYVRTTGSLLKQVDISWCMKNIQLYMLDHLDFKKVFIDIYKRDRFVTFLLEYFEHVACSLNQVHLEGVANIQCYISQRKHSLKKKCQVILTTFVLEYLVNLYSFGALGIYG